MIDFKQLIESNNKNKEYTDFQKNFDINNGIENNEKKILLDIILKIKENNISLDKIFNENNKTLTNEEKLQIKEKLKDNKEFLKQLVGEAHLDKVTSKTSVFIPPKSIDSLIKNVFSEKDLDKLLNVGNMNKDKYLSDMKNEKDEIKSYLLKVEEISKIIYDSAVEKHYRKNKNNDMTGILNTVKETVTEFINKDDIFKKLNKEREGNLTNEILNNVDMYELLNKLHSIHYGNKNKQIDYEMTNTFKMSG